VSGGVWRGSCPKCGYWAFAEDHPGIVDTMQRHCCLTMEKRGTGPVEIRKQRDRAVYVEALLRWVDVDGRDPNCVLAWPECYSGGYDPACCRFPKSCSC
jgi:hypothetical protein